MSFINTVRDSSINCVKSFSIGVASGLMLAPVGSGISYAAQACGFLPTITSADSIREGIAKIQESMKNNNPFNITYDVEKLVNAKCYYEEYARQYNSYIPRCFAYTNT